MKVKLKLHTDGRGSWTYAAKQVRIKKLELFLPYSGANFAELRVYFYKQDWKIERHGLIYTDPLFLKELKAQLKGLNLPAKSVDYSEQGMQGDDYVSLDAGPSFVKSWPEAIYAE